jgi:UDP-N-acetylglucosamine 2-epimerase (non-hydrolysing)
MRILTVFGTRPEAIKLAPIILRLQGEPGINSRVCVTGQHRQMLDQVLELFGIAPDDDLELMTEDQSLFQLTSKAMVRLEAILQRCTPDAVVVQGDTTTAMITSLAAFYLKIPVAHVEAGLRTGNKYRPFPEEINRCLIDVVCDWHFAPTATARRNLLSEGRPNDRIFVTGNTAIDALFMTLRKQAAREEQEKLENKLLQRFGVSLDVRRKLLLVTGHRRESFGRDFEEICCGIRMIAEQNPNVEVVYPVHLNPKVQEPVFRILKGVERTHLIPPVDYDLFVWMLSRCYMVLTDSGGIQEEAPSLRKPVLIMRKETERREGLEVGVADLIGTEAVTISRKVQILLNDSNVYRRMSSGINPYGDGHASQRIVETIKRMVCTRTDVETDKSSSVASSIA